MESQNIEFRAVVNFLTYEDANAKKTNRRLADVYGYSSPKWSAKF